MFFAKTAVLKYQNQKNIHSNIEKILRKLQRNSTHFYSNLIILIIVVKMFDVESGERISFVRSLKKIVQIKEDYMGS